MTPQEEVKNLKNTELQFIGKLIIETQKKVDSLAISVSRRNATIAAIGVKVEQSIDYGKECDERLTEVEDWKNTHAGEESGKKKNITLIATVAGLVITGVTLWYTTIKPTLDKSIGLISKATAIENLYQDLKKN